jgi:chromosome segregation protein
MTDGRARSMNDVTLIGAPTVEEIRIRFALPLLTLEADHWREFLEGAKTSDLDSDRIGDLKEEIEGYTADIDEKEEEIGEKDEAIGELEKKLGEVRHVLDCLRADLAESKRSKLYPIVMERVQKIEEILKREE